MRIVEQEYEAFAEDHFPNMVLVRAWADCNVWSAGIEQPLLVLADNTSQRVAIFEYDTFTEREKDILLVRSLPNGEAGAGGAVPAFIRPTPPGRPAAEAQFLPLASRENELQ